jgi:PAS domain S-box-containing protein
LRILQFFRLVREKITKEAPKEENCSTLYKRAEKPFQSQATELSGPSIGEGQHLIHELQIESARRSEELLNTQGQLNKLQEKYADLYDFAPVGYCTLDQHGRILDANLTAAKQLGVERKFLLDTRFEDYIVEEEQDEFCSHLKKIFATKTRQICEVRLKRKHGSQFYAQLDSIIVQNHESNLPLCRTSISDLTELNRAKNALLRRDSELALFNRVSRAFDSTLDLDQILVTVLNELRRLLEVTACSIWLIDPATNELVCQHSIGPYSDVVRDWRLTQDQGIVGWVAKTGTSVIVSDALADDRHFNGVDRQTGYPLRSILSVPLRIKQEVIGVLQVLDTEVGRFNSTDQALQELLAAMASLAIENARLYEQTRQDANTKEILQYEVNHRVKNTLSVITSLLSSVRRHSRLKKDSIGHSLMTDVIPRVQGIKVVLNLLSEFEWNPLPLSELCNRVIQFSLASLAPEKQITFEVSPSTVRISPERVSSMGLIINELVTNTVKHGLADRGTEHITVHIARMGDTIQVELRDDGPGYPDDVLKFERYNLGLYLVQKIVRKNLEGKLILDNDHGAVTIIRYKPRV